MHASTARYPKWMLFISLLAVHVLLTWKAFQLDWLLLEEAAIWPVLLLESIRINLSTCHEFICLPNATGWAVCLLVWGVVYYLLATWLGRWAERIR